GHPPIGQGEAPLPQPGADPADPRPVDRQVPGAPSVGARGSQERAGGGDGMTTGMETTVTTQVYRVYIKATPEAIWDAITKPEWSERYGYGGGGGGEQPAGGGRAAVSDASAEAGGGQCAPPRKLVQTWRMLMDPQTEAEGFTRLTYEIVETGP